MDRLINIWWLAYLFWLAGTATVLLVRPRDTRWLLLVAFYYVTALWLITGNTSRWHMWESAVVLRVATWLSIPIYLHLHWIFPRPLRQLPSAIWWSIYGIGGLLAISQWFLLVPSNAYVLGFMLAIIGSLALLGIHFVSQPNEHRAIRPLMMAMVFAIVPMIGVSIAQLFQEASRSGYAALLALPLIPIAYFYTTYRHRLGGLELRANRLIALYIFLLLLGMGVTIIVSVLTFWFDSPATTVFIGLAIPLLTSVIVMFGFAPFRRFVESHWLGLPLPPTDVLETYASLIATSLDLANLTRVLQREVLPSLLVRQFAMLRLVDHNEVRPVCWEGLTRDQLPNPQETAMLLAKAGENRVFVTTDDTLPACAWVRLILPLQFGDRLIGLWLLGRRDPDDFYSQSELATFEALADQTVIALINIEQAEQLRAVYQANIDRHEMERTRLAHILHDEILNLFPSLFMHMEDISTSPEFEKTYQELTTRIRQMITGLRPVMLTYGLKGALEELVDALAEQADNDLTIELDLADTQARFPPRIEQYLFRIVQQTCENAVRHARAKTIRIYGTLESNGVNLIIEDDGIGFVTGSQLDLPHLLAKQHFGLVGMYERAALIGADLRIHSRLGEGTRVSLVWQPTSTPIMDPVSQPISE